MKKYLSLIAFVMMAVVSLSLTACGDDDDDDNVGSTSELVGTWEIINATLYSTTGESKIVKSGDGAYWVFTADKLTVYHSEDLANGESFGYAYNSSSKELYIAGHSPFHVTALSKGSLTLRSDEISSTYYYIIKFKKRSKRRSK